MSSRLCQCSIQTASLMESEWYLSSYVIDFCVVFVLFSLPLDEHVISSNALTVTLLLWWQKGIQSLTEKPLSSFFVFYSTPHCSRCKCCTSYSNSVRLSVRPSVHLSVCLSHADIVSKRRHVARCSLHCRTANVSSFVKTKKYSPRTTPSP